MNADCFYEQFKQLAGHAPLSWQTRLYRDWVAGKSYEVIDLPTGLGKTMVMAIWLIARANKLDVPTRQIYVVDRRTVVDQATDLAEKLVKNWKEKKIFEGEPPAISTLRGQLADNREWSRDPSRPGIIIGTVDLIGSALLFSGYRSSYKRRPLEAGLLGQDSLLVLDEAHLSRPFEKLLGSIEQFNKVSCGMGVPPVKPLRLIRMSATRGNSEDAKPFMLDFDGNGNLTGEDAKNETIIKRFGASKTLRVVESDKQVEAIATEADKLANDKLGSRIVIFVRTPKLVADVRKSLEKKNKDYTTRIAQLTGTMRGLERDELVDTEESLAENDRERRVMQRFLKPDNDPSQGSCFLISTSAGEVGFDLNADHLVCDATTIDSLIQRLGRVNRRGGKDRHATVILVRELAKKKDGKPVELKGLDLAIANTISLLEGVKDVSPKNIVTLKSDDWKNKYKDACSPEPTTVELTDILLDAWSMTSIIEPMPGRPPVDPWLRGIAEWEPPRTEVAWRAELDLEGFSDLKPTDIEEWFDTHRILTHETLSEMTSEVASWFKDRRKAIPESEWNTMVGRPVIIDRAGLEVVPLGEVINRLSRSGNDADAFLRGAKIVLPASFGGIRPGVGLLDSTEPKLDKSEEGKSPDDRKAILQARQDAIDVADVRGRFREKIVKSEDSESESTSLDPAAHKPRPHARFALQFESDDDKTVRLISYVPKTDRPDMGRVPQTLEGHVFDVREQADDIIQALKLKEDDPIRLAVELANDWHDHGKNREPFQLVVGGTASDDPRPWPDHVWGKSGGKDRGKPRRNYRHEFGSLREFTDAFKAGKLLDRAGKQISKEVFDLAAHLIATHHGRGRPHFPKGAFDPLAEPRSDELHVESIRRFAHLQRRYGWWYLAWLENLLRCPDALASEKPTTGIIGEDTEGGDQ